MLMPIASRDDMMSKIHVTAEHFFVAATSVVCNVLVLDLQLRIFMTADTPILHLHAMQLNQTLSAGFLISRQEWV
jgi:hypothetical protein